MRLIPSRVSNFFPVIRKVVKIKAVINMNMAEVTKGINSTCIGEIRATIPIISVELATTVPISSPMLISLCFSFDAEIPNTSSGSVVAIESKKSPIIILGN